MISFPLSAKTVRLGYYIDSGNFMSGSSPQDPRYGYAYEYMQIISSYTGWDYEYVYGTWDDLYPALLKGEIDILSDVTRTSDREKLMLFPDYSMGQETYYIYSCKNKEGENLLLSPGDYLAWKGKSIGIRKDCYHYELFNEWQRNKKVDLKYVYLMTTDPYEKMFANNEFDLLIETDMVADPSWNLVEKIGSSDFYLAVSKGRKDILCELNSALAEIFAMNPYFNNNMWLTYFSDVAVLKTLTPRESEWLNKNPVIKVGCLDDYLPFTDYDEETDRPEGIVVDVFDTVPIVFGRSDVSFEYVFYDDFQKILSDLSEGKIHVVTPVIRSLEWAEKKNFAFSISYASYPMGYVYREGNFKSSGKIAVTKNMASQTFVEEYYSDSEILFYKDFEACLDSVLDGETDGAVFNIYKIRGLLNRYKRFNKLSYIVLSKADERACLVSKYNTPLISILNKFYMIAGNRYVDETTEYYAVKEQSYDRKTFLQDHLVLIIIACVLFILISTGLVLSLRQIKYDIEHDILTRLYNRRKLDYIIKKMMKKADSKNECFGLLLFDIDNFKSLNDTYGHEAGDFVLKKIAYILKNGIGSKDAAFRWGGEELLVVCKGNAQEVYFMAEKLRNEISCSVLCFLDKEINFTVTVGVSLYEKNKSYIEMFRTADENLYRGKNTGKNKVVL